MNIGPIQLAAEILGDKWTPLLLRCLANENVVRFCKLQDNAGGINPRTLSARLAFLEVNGIIEKNRGSDSARCDYQLTEKGRELIPVLREMSKWSIKHHTDSTQIA